jgi:Arc/MetJ family transcription regulator
MSLCRREFLRGSLSASALLLTGEAALASVPARSSTLQGRPILLLRSAGDEAFAAAALRAGGLRAASPVVSLALDEELVRDPAALRTLLGRHRGARLIGLMDDCTHALLEEALRDLGGSVLCRGYHRGLLHDAAASRHTFTTTSATRGIGSALAAALRVGGSDFLVQEHTLGTGDAGARDGSSLPVASWPELLGRSHLLMAAGTWTAGATVAEHRHGAATDVPGSQAFASLVAEI